MHEATIQITARSASWARILLLEFAEDEVWLILRGQRRGRRSMKEAKEICQGAATASLECCLGFERLVGRIR